MSEGWGAVVVDDVVEGVEVVFFDGGAVVFALFLDAVGAVLGSGVAPSWHLQSGGVAGGWGGGGDDGCGGGAQGGGQQAAAGPAP